MQQITPELMEATRNLVRFARVTKGDNVLLAVGRGYEDPVLEQAILLAAEEKGANVSVLTRVVGVPSGRPGRGDVIKVLEDASRGMDIVFVNGLFVTRSLSIEVAMKDHGTIFVRLGCYTAEAMASEQGRFPTEIMQAISNKMLDIMSTAKSMRVTSALGTDMTIGINPRNIFPYGPFKWPSWMTHFPGANFGIDPAGASVPSNGVWYVEHFESELLPAWWLDKPVKVTIKDNMAVDVQGPYADTILRLFEKYENSRITGGCHFGIHPKSPPVDRRSPPGRHDRRHTGPDMIHFSMGKSGSVAPGVRISKIHIDSYQYNPTITVEGRKLTENGRLLLVNDPDIRQIASQFGDPDQLLAPLHPPSVMPEF